MQHLLLRTCCAILALLLFSVQNATAQTPTAALSDCEKLLRDGKRLMGQKKYDDALDQFWAALVTCQNEAGGAQVSRLIQQAQEAYISELADAVESEKKALAEALAAKSQAEAAKQKEEIARREAEQNAQRAREQGIRAESRRLALLADNTRSKGQKSDAVLLAYLALRLSGTSNAQTANPELTTPLMRAFGEAVRDSFGVAVFEGKTPIEQVLPSPDGLHLLVKLTDQSLYRVSLGDREPLLLVQPGKQPLSAAWSPQSDRLLTWTANAPTRLWKPDGSLLAALEGHAEAVRFAAFSPDGQILVTCSRDNTARLWDGTGRLLATLTGHTGNVYGAAFSVSGKNVLTRSSDGTARVWNRDGQFLATVGSTHQYLYDAKPCPADGLFVTAEADGAVRCWDIGGKPVGLLSRHEGAARELLFTQKGEVLSRGADKWVRIGSTLPGVAERSLRHPAAVSGFALSPDESRLLTWADDLTVRLWDLAAGQMLQVFTGHRGKILTAAFSPDQQHILTSAKDGLAKLWDTSGNVLSEWVINPDHPLPAMFLPGGQHIAVADATNRTVSSSPFPQAVFQKMEATTDLNSPLVGQLARRYNVQFLGEISQ